ncbi:hypothetical protein [Nonomuraea dietziae]|uniref:hypothetical protein n=1 Tax=Nonomuraea dietziae TaxID=65515 RepID=UPI0031D28ABE
MDPDFRRLYVAAFGSQFGTQLSHVALPLLAVTALNAGPGEVGPAQLAGDADRAAGGTARRGLGRQGAAASRHGRDGRTAGAGDGVGDGGPGGWTR